MRAARSASPVNWLAPPGSTTRARGSAPNGEAGDIGRCDHRLHRKMGALNGEHQIPYGRHIGRNHVHIHTQTMAEHATWLADAPSVVDGEADGHGMQHGAAIAH